MDVETSVEDCKSILLAGVEYGNQELIILLVEKGVSLNIRSKDNRTLLNIAIEKGHLGLAEMFIDLGFDVNEQWEERHYLRRNAKSLLDIAIEREHKDIVTLLLDRGALISENSLISAVESYSTGYRLTENGSNQEQLLEIIDILLENGAKINDSIIERALLFSKDGGQIIARILYRNTGDSEQLYKSFFKQLDKILNTRVYMSNQLLLLIKRLANTYDVILGREIKFTEAGIDTRIFFDVFVKHTNMQAQLDLSQYPYAIRNELIPILNNIESLQEVIFDALCIETTNNIPVVTRDEEQEFVSMRGETLQTFYGLPSFKELSASTARVQQLKGLVLETDEQYLAADAIRCGAEYITEVAEGISISDRVNKRFLMWYLDDQTINEVNNLFRGLINISEPILERLSSLLDLVGELGHYGLSKELSKKIKNLPVIINDVFVVEVEEIVEKDKRGALELIAPRDVQDSPDDAEKDSSFGIQYGGDGSRSDDEDEQVSAALASAPPPAVIEEPSGGAREYKEGIGYGDEEGEEDRSVPAAVGGGSGIGSAEHERQQQQAEARRQEVKDYVGRVEVLHNNLLIGSSLLEEAARRGVRATNLILELGEDPEISRGLLAAAERQGAAAVIDLLFNRGSTTQAEHHQLPLLEARTSGEAGAQSPESRGNERSDDKIATYHIPSSSNLDDNSVITPLLIIGASIVKFVESKEAFRYIFSEVIPINSDDVGGGSSKQQHQGQAGDSDNPYQYQLELYDKERGGLETFVLEHGGWIGLHLIGGMAVTFSFSSEQISLGEKVLSPVISSSSYASRHLYHSSVKHQILGEELAQSCLMNILADGAFGGLSALPYSIITGSPAPMIYGTAQAAAISVIGCMSSSNTNNDGSSYISSTAANIVTAGSVVYSYHQGALTLTFTSARDAIFSISKIATTASIASLVHRTTKATTDSVYNWWYEESASENNSIEAPQTSLVGEAEF